MTNFQHKCAWCDKDLVPSEDIPRQKIVTHGICKECLNKVLCQEVARPLTEYLNYLSVPILLVDSNVEVKHTNLAASKLLGKQISEINGQLGGKVIECKHSREPGGCGKTIHCEACEIRNAVTHTFKTGESKEKIPCYREIITSEGIKKIRLMISTEKENDVVFLRVDELGPDEES